MTPQAVRNLALAMTLRYSAMVIYIAGFIWFAITEGIIGLGLSFAVAFALWGTSIVYDWKFILPFLKGGK